MAVSFRSLSPPLNFSSPSFPPRSLFLPLTTASPPHSALPRRYSSSTTRLNYGTKTTKASMAEIITPKSRGKVLVFDSDEDLATSLAKYTTDLATNLSQQKDSFTVALSGGSLVKSLRKLVEQPYIDLVDWSKWHVFWVDERVVPKDHPDSNYLLAYNDFLSKVPIPSGHVYSMNDALSAEGAADDYETCLRHLVKTKTIDQSESGGFPKFDLMLMGIGPDGHIASLFPGHHLLQESQKWITSIKDSPKPPPERISFTLPVINASANVALVVTGSGKASAVHTALSDVSNSEVLPVQLVSPEGELTWFLDKEAASKL
ncbi:probable 6-phosphogluconolactonase 4, chloroplastic [Andrographis paniculata]|uniref:probable 6-phosphogluconolactonase 4, chloroplastic n=1 Tax=Andrographis paniculata TaxID=175694 RepID=UPI0021E74DDB|nr:probable 6-phosphogluconolactonase 4, chloroplastic [Andrographis paniculata]